MAVFEVEPDVDHRTGPNSSDITGNFLAAKENGVWYDFWDWNSGWPTGTWFMYGMTTNPVSGSTTLKTRAQEFLGTASTISPSGSGTAWQIWYQGTRVGQVYVDADAKTAKWWMYHTSYTPSGPYLPTPTDSKPLEFVLGGPITASGWEGTNM